MFKTTIFILTFLICIFSESKYDLPVKTSNRKSINTLSLTKIGEFGLMRKARPNVPSHYHTGIDLKRPTNNYNDEAIFPIYQGVVISKRQDGPYAQLIIEHDGNPKFWTIYEHIAGIQVNLNDIVKADKPIARFMNKTELDKYGWQFDHFHFEVLKKQPIRLKPDKSKPDRLFSSYTLVCFTEEKLNECFYNPVDFLKQ